MDGPRTQSVSFSKKAITNMLLGGLPECFDCPFIFLLYTWHIRRKRSMSSDYVLQAWQVSLQTKGSLYIVIQFSAVAGTIQVEWNSGKTSLTIRVQLLSDCVQLRTLQRRLATISFTVCTLRITKHNSGSSFLNVNELKFNDFIWLTLVFVLLQ